MSPPILHSKLPPVRIDIGRALARAVALSGMSQNRVAIDLFSATLGARRMRLPEYVAQGAWKGKQEERAAYVGLNANRRLNRSLTGPSPYDHVSLMLDKYPRGLGLEAGGFPAPQIKAAVGTVQRFGAPRTLSSATELAAWLSDGSDLPAFAKPVAGSMALGSIPPVAAGGGGLDVGGKVVPVRDLAAKVARTYGSGWLIQELLQQPEKIEALIGPGIGTVRMVTLRERVGPQVMYSIWHHPAPGTRVDAAIHGSPNAGCALDSEGQVASAWRGDALSVHDITHNVVAPELRLVGVRLTQWPELASICCEAHWLFPGHAPIGWDIAMTRRGPLICEVNANPLDLSCKRSFRRGFLHPDNMGRLDAVRRLMHERMGITLPKEFRE